MKKIIDWFKFLIPLAGLIFLILSFFDRSLLVNLNFVMSTILGLYAVLLGFEGIVLKDDRKYLYIFYFLFGSIILIFNFKILF